MKLRVPSTNSFTGALMLLILSPLIILSALLAFIEGGTVAVSSWWRDNLNWRERLYRKIGPNGPEMDS